MSRAKEHVLITGGGGYIGSVLVPIMLDLGYQVTVIDNFMYGQLSLLDCCHNPNLTVVYDDVRNVKTLSKYVAKADIIVPLAAIVGAPACERVSETAVEINLKQIEAISKLQGMDQRLIFPVTNSGYGIGDGEKECDEASPLRPISLYGRTKVEAEAILLEKQNAVTFRLATVFGVAPRMRLDLLVNDFVYRAHSDRYVVLFESHFRRNYIHIRDVAGAFVHGINHYDSMKGNAYNVGLTSANLSKLDLCLRIKEHVPDFQIVENEFATDPDKRDYIVSNAKLEATGWRPQYTLDDGIAELLRAYRFLRVSSFNNK